MEKGGRVRKLLCIWSIGFVFLSSCSALQSKPVQSTNADERAQAARASDPFDDPFYSSARGWDASVLEHSEIISQTEMETPEGVIQISDEEESTVEKSQNIVFSSMMVGTSVAKLLLVPLLIP